jgi:hypothetical protein
MPKITRSKLTKIIQEEVENAAIEEGIGDRIGAAWKGLTGKSGKSGGTDMSKYPEPPSEEEKKKKEAGYKQSAGEWEKTKEKWLKKGQPPQPESGDGTSAPGGSSEDHGDASGPGKQQKGKKANVKAADLRAKPVKGKILTTKSVVNRLKAAGITDQKVIDQANRVIKKYIEKAVAGQVPIYEAVNLAVGGQSLLKQLMKVPGLRSVPDGVIKQILKDLEVQLTANNIEVIKSKKDLVAARQKPDEGAAEAGAEEAGAEEAGAEEAGAEEAGAEEAGIKDNDLMKALQQLRNVGHFNPKEFLRKFAAYKKSSISGLGGYVAAAVKSGAPNDAEKEILAKVASAFQSKGVEPLEKAFDNATKVLRDLYAKVGAEAQLQESFDYSQLTEDGRKVLLICLSPYLNNKAQPRTINESYTKRSHLIGDKLMKKWNLNS